MKPFDYLLDKIHRGKNPYTGFPVSQWKGTWFFDPGAQRDIFRKVIEQAQPGIVIEVGSFVGESAIFMANNIAAQRLNAAILSVDTFCGGIDHWTKANEKIQFHYGRVDLYYKFIANVITHGCDDVIVPLSLDSLNAARLLKELWIKPDLVYLDASHEEGDVRRDLDVYWDLLKPGGVLMADDISRHFPGVVEDWVAFLSDNKLKAFAIEGEKQAVMKPPLAEELV